MFNMRVGHGYDAHRFAAGRDLILGGVKIDCEVGLLGHSDADVLAHAIMDALLGSLALGDIGKHFPDTDEKYRGADSLELMRHVGALIRERGWEISNIDATVIAEKPKLAPYIAEMRRRISEVLALDFDSVGVKATTEEKMGFTGRCEGIRAHAVVLVYKSI